MKIKKISVALTSVALLSLPLAAQALSYVNPSTSIGLGTADLKDTVTNIINWVLGLLGIVAVIMILYGGFIWLTAGGNDEKVENAKKILGSAVIGLVIVILAWAIVNFVVNTTNDVST